MTAPEKPETKSLDFKVVGEPLNRLLTAVGHKLSREWPAQYRDVNGARELFVMHIRIAQIQRRQKGQLLCGDIPRDPLRKPEFIVSLPVLNRTLVDSLFTVLFILENVPARCEWFWEADWKETHLELDRYTAEYGHLPEWKEWLAGLADHCANGIAHAKLSPDQVANPSSLRSWLNPGAMANHGVVPGSPLPPVRTFMKYLNDFFYVDLSQQAHLGGWGMVKRAAFLLDGIRDTPAVEVSLKKNRLAHIGQTVGLVLSLASEIEAHFAFGLKQQTLFVWNVAAPVIVVVDELYEKRYRALLG